MLLNGGINGVVHVQIRMAQDDRRGTSLYDLHDPADMSNLESEHFLPSYMPSNQRLVPCRNSLSA